MQFNPKLWTLRNQEVLLIIALNTCSAFAFGKEALNHPPNHEPTLPISAELKEEFNNALDAGNLISAKTFLRKYPNLANSSDNLIAWTPLHSASIRGDFNIVKLLLQYGADVNAKDNDGWRPLHIAASRGYIEVMDLLITHGTDVNARGYHDSTPLHEAVESGYREAVELLLSRGANPEVKTDYGITALHRAVALGRLGAAEALLKKGANVNARDNEGKTPLQHLRNSNRGSRIIQLFKKYGATDAMISEKASDKTSNADHEDSSYKLVYHFKELKEPIWFYDAHCYWDGGSQSYCLQDASGHRYYFSDAMSIDFSDLHLGQWIGAMHWTNFAARRPHFTPDEWKQFHEVLENVIEKQFETDGNGNHNGWRVKKSFSGMMKDDFARVSMDHLWRRLGHKDK